MVFYAIPYATLYPIQAVWHLEANLSSVQGSLQCFVSMQTFIQVAINWFCYFMIFLMLAIYVKNTEHKPMAKFQFRLSMTIYLLWGVIGGLAITFVYLLALGGPNSEQTNVTARYNQVLGTIGIVTIVLQWSPQIVTTFLHRGPGALSWITLSINAPGACATAVSQIASGATFAIWLPYLLSGLQQFIIVGLIIFFCVLNRRKKIKDVIDEDPGFQGPALLLHDDDDESAPLNTRASYSLDTQSPFSASSPSSSINRAFSDSEYSTSITEDEELGEEDDDSSDPTAALIRRRNKRGLPTRRLQDSSVSQSVPGYSSLLPTE